MHVDAAAGGAFLADRQQVHALRQHRKGRERQGERGNGGDERRVAADVEISHQPSHRPERLGVIRQELHEENQGREKRVERDARQQQHIRRNSAVPGAGQRVHNPDGTERTGEAGNRHGGKAGDARRKVQRQRQHRAQRGARRHAESKRRGERVSQQRLKHDARRGERRSHHGAREHAGKPRDEKNLRVQIIRKRN